MRHPFCLSALLVSSLIAATSSALGQSTSGTVSVSPTDATTINPGSLGISSSPGGSSTTATGIGAGTDVRSNSGLYTGTTGSSATTGTGSASRDLLADDPLHTGFNSLAR